MSVFVHALYLRQGTAGAIGGCRPDVVRKILIWLFVGFLVFFAARRPEAAAAVIRFVGALLAGLANGLSDMVSHVVT